jgi:hypothetical protein
MFCTSPAERGLPAAALWLPGGAVLSFNAEQAGSASGLPWPGGVFLRSNHGPESALFITFA